MLGDGKGMMIRPNSTDILGPKAKGRKSLALQSKFGLRSGIVVVDVAHVPEPHCAMDGGLYLFDIPSKEKGPVRIIMSEVIGWDPSNMMSYANGNIQGAPRIHKRPGKESFAVHANRNGGVVFVVKFNATDLQIFDLQGDEIAKLIPTRGKAPDDIDVRKLPKDGWNKKDANVSVALGAPMKLNFEIGFCEPNTMLAFDDPHPQDRSLIGFPNTCRSSGLTCQQMVTTRPQEFKEVYWNLRSAWFYEG
ncbi:hypothetical protein BT63DRAFT_164264 [Microthyrium microscopicum]|uniref:Uncharacterized protein n=1 Tax=Microthyrium microscopicum TaxID=703497 RepID=A0A6A6UQH7_9PEZI|nr:hypothetical protein BT63DRAFT_164264 [Microthyrium microscopicum]